MHYFQYQNAAFSRSANKTSGQVVASKAWQEEKEEEEEEEGGGGVVTRLQVPAAKRSSQLGFIPAPGWDWSLLITLRYIQKIRCQIFGGFFSSTSLLNYLETIWELLLFIRLFEYGRGFWYFWNPFDMNYQASNYPISSIHHIRSHDTTKGADASWHSERKSVTRHQSVTMRQKCCRTTELRSGQHLSC